MKKYYKVLPFLVLLGCGWISWHSGAAIMVLRDLWLILSGRFNEVNSVNEMLSLVLTTITILGISILFWIIRLISNHKTPSSHFLYSEFAKGENAELLISMILGVIIEEVVFRWFVFGVLTKLHFLSGDVAFYVLFFLSTIIFAWIHLFNYKDKTDRRINKLPVIFIMSIFFTYVYVKYGLLGAIMAHLINNLFWFANVLLVIKYKGFKYVY